MGEMTLVLLRLGYSAMSFCRVVANNDIPRGAAHMSLVATIRYIHLHADVSASNAAHVHQVAHVSFTSLSTRRSVLTICMSWHFSTFTCACNLCAVCRRDRADQQPFSVRQPNYNVSLWPDNRLPQTLSSNQSDTPISNPAATNPCSPRAAEQSSIYNLDCRSKHQVS